jgi:hypothetical protein
MPVKKEPSGRRSVQAEIEVTGSPEGVWQAIASGHFQGQPSELVQLLATSTEAKEKAWDLLTQPLGLATARVGEHVATSRSASSTRSSRLTSHVGVDTSQFHSRASK